MYFGRDLACVKNIQHLNTKMIDNDNKWLYFWYFDCTIKQKEWIFNQHCCFAYSDDAKICVYFWFSLVCGFLYLTLFSIISLPIVLWNLIYSEHNTHTHTHNKAVCILKNTIHKQFCHFDLTRLLIKTSSQLSMKSIWFNHLFIQFYASLSTLDLSVVMLVKKKKTLSLFFWCHLICHSLKFNIKWGL